MSPVGLFVLPVPIVDFTIEIAISTLKMNLKQNYMFAWLLNVLYIVGLPIMVSIVQNKFNLLQCFIRVEVKLLYIEFDDIKIMILIY